MSAISRRSPSASASSPATPSARDAHVVARELEQPAQRFARVGVVFDDQDVAPGSAASRPPRARSTAQAHAIGGQAHGERRCPCPARRSRALAVPPCSSASRRTSVRPMPRPPCERSSAALALHEELEDARAQLLRTCRLPVSLTAQHGVVAVLARRDTRIVPPAGVNLSALPSRLRDDLLDARRVGVDPDRLEAAARGDGAPSAARGCAAWRARAPPRRRGRAAGAASTILPIIARAGVEQVVGQAREVLDLRAMTARACARGFASIRGCVEELRSRWRSRRAGCAARGRASPGTRPWRGSPPRRRRAPRARAAGALRAPPRRARARRRQRRARCRPRGSRRSASKAAPRPRAGRGPARRRSAGHRAR